MRFSTPCLAIVVTAGGAAACVNARDSYDDYGDRLVDADTRPIDGEIVSTLPDITGTNWYMVDEVTVGAELKRVYFTCSFELRPITENTGELDWTAQSLNWQTLEPVGEPFTATNVPVRSDASADIPMVGVLPAAANSISGSNAPVDAMIHVQLRAADFVCGSLTGEAGALPLDGINTFAGIRYEGELPEPIISCDDQPDA